MKSILGRKIGMTQVFDETGAIQAVTVVEAGPCVVLQRKTNESDGYSAVQLGFLDKKLAKNNSPEKGHFKKAGLTTGKKFVTEIRVPESVQIEVGSIIPANVFTPGERVSVTGVSVGKGFQGTTKRWNFVIGPKSHGSKNHRQPGTLGIGTGISNVFPGKKLPGKMGNKKRTALNLKIVDVLLEKNIILVHGSIPGAKNGFVVIENQGAEYDPGKIIKQGAPVQAAAVEAPITAAPQN